MRKQPVNMQERAKKNVREGRGTSVQGLLKGRGGTNYEFSTSNPMWRASLEILDFLPMTTVDYSGGVIISDWYTPPETPDEKFKLNVFILGRSLRADGIRVSVFRKTKTASGVWSEAPVQQETQVQLENAILTRARQFRTETREQ